MSPKNRQLIWHTTPHWNKQPAPGLQDKRPKAFVHPFLWYDGSKRICTSIPLLLLMITIVRMALFFPSCPLHANSSYLTFNPFFCPVFCRWAICFWGFLFWLYILSPHMLYRNPKSVEVQLQDSNQSTMITRGCPGAIWHLCSTDL